MLVQRSTSMPEVHLGEDRSSLYVNGWGASARLKLGRIAGVAPASAVLSCHQTRSMRLGLDVIEPCDLAAAVSSVKPAWQGTWAIQVACGRVLPEGQWQELRKFLRDYVLESLSPNATRIGRNAHRMKRRVRRWAIIGDAILGCVEERAALGVKGLSKRLDMAERDCRIIHRESMAILMNAAENAAKQAVDALRGGYDAGAPMRSPIPARA
jgi:hypothetical protein